jgi:hypothetical protein
MPADELAILRKYAAGAELAAIAADLNISRDAVAEVISGVNYQRGRAAELLRQREAALVKRVPTLAAPAVKEATVHPEPPVHVKPQPDTIEQQLLRAEAIPRLKTRALRIRAMLDDLNRDLEGAAQIVAAERRVERLRAELAAATETLRRMVKPATKQPAAAAAPPSPGTDPDSGHVRRWAAENNVECSPHGRPKRSVIDQYLAAHPIEDAA